MKQAYLTTRQQCLNPLHHLWNNHGTWWFHGTFHLPNSTAERVRVNLRTADLASARLRRDDILAGHCFQRATRAQAA